eukprot:scaffold23513_cov62-Attheya_sp.AAC.4
MTSTAPKGVVGIIKEVVLALRMAFSNLCTSDSGVLFENALVQVGVKHEYMGAQGRMSVFFVNLSSEPLHHFKVRIDDYEHLRMQKQGTGEGLLDEGDGSSEGCTIEPKTEAKLLLLVEVMAPFDDAPAMCVSFELPDTHLNGSKHEYLLRLPIVATCFMEPVTLEPGAFMQRWKSLEGQEGECKQLIKALPSVTTIDEELMGHIIKKIVDGLKFGRCGGCDPTLWTISGAATFRTGAKDMKGNNINVGCLVRVKANPQAQFFRVTTQTLHPLCSKAVKNVALVSIRLA